MASATPSLVLARPMRQLRVRARALRSSGAFAMRTAVPAISSMETSFQLSPMARIWVGVDAVRGGEREDGGAFGAAGGEDVEDGEVAAGVFGAVEGEDGFGLGVSARWISASHPFR